MQPVNVIEGVWQQGTTPKVLNLSGQAFYEEAGAHRFEISAIAADGTALTLTGTVTAKFLRADGTTVAIDGSISSGKAVVTLVSDCYHVPGRYSIAIYVTTSGVSTCVYAACGIIFRTSSDTVIDSGSTIPTLAQLEAAYNNCVTATTAANNAAAAAGDVASRLDGRTDNVNYAWQDTVQTASSGNLSFSRQGTRLTVNGTADAATYVQCRMGGAISTAAPTPTSGQCNASYGATLLAGHEYRLVSRLISGTETNTTTNPGASFVMPIKAGTAGTVYGGTAERHGSDVYTRIGIVGTTTKCILWWSAYQGCSFDNCVYEISLEDVTQANNANYALTTAESIIAPVEYGTAAQNYAAGDLLTMGGNLYKATTAITTGETLAVGTNISLSSVQNELKARDNVDVQVRSENPADWLYKAIFGDDSDWGWTTGVNSGTTYTCYKKTGRLLRMNHSGNSTWYTHAVLTGTVHRFTYGNDATLLNDVIANGDSDFIDIPYILRSEPTVTTAKGFIRLYNYVTIADQSTAGSSNRAIYVLAIFRRLNTSTNAYEYSDVITLTGANGFETGDMKFLSGSGVVLAASSNYAASTFQTACAEYEQYAIYVSRRSTGLAGTILIEPRWERIPLDATT